MSQGRFAGHGAPPPQLQAEIAFASARATELAAQDRELHFDQAAGAGGPVVVQVRDLAGSVIGTIAGADALDIMSGAELP